MGSSKGAGCIPQLKLITLRRSLRRPGLAAHRRLALSIAMPHPGMLVGELRACEAATSRPSPQHRDGALSVAHLKACSLAIMPYTHPHNAVRSGASTS